MDAQNIELEPDSEWQKPPFANWLRYRPSQVYFARIRVKGKLIRRSLKTNQLSVAKLQIADLEKSERQKVQSFSGVANGKLTFGDAPAVFKQRLRESLDVEDKKKEYAVLKVKAKGQRDNITVVGSLPSVSAG